RALRAKLSLPSRRHHTQRGHLSAPPGYAPRGEAAGITLAGVRQEAEGPTGEDRLDVAPKLTVAIVSWNTRDLLGRCLRSLKPDVARGLAQVWVVEGSEAP